jgi:sugar lactone lactonase YvrE
MNLLSADAVVRPVSSPCQTGESPFWHPEEQALYWVDVAARCLYRLDPSSGASRRWDFESEVSACAPLLGGGLLLAMRDGIWRFDARRFRLHRMAPPPYDPRELRFNDAKADAVGRFWVGTIHDARANQAALYCYDRRRGSRHAMGLRATGMANVNGIAWSPDARTLYWADTKAHTLYAADHEPASGELSQRRVFHAFAPRTPGLPIEAYGGRPDGAAMDVEGCYWVAMYEGAQVLRLSPAGEVVGRLPLPVQCPTMPCFGGHDLKTLYITTASAHRSAAELAQMPLSGCVLSVPVPVAGLPVNYAQA